jgi:xanthine dehydrogenase accessory factor
MADKNIYLELLNFLLEKKQCVLATVVASQGSTPQKPGSSAIYDRARLLSGTVGGGLVEHLVGLKSMAACESKKPGLFTFDLGGELVRKDDVICGGNMRVLVDASPEKSLPVLLQLKESLQNRVPGVLLTLAEFGEASDLKIKRSWFTKSIYPGIPEAYTLLIEPGIKEMLETSAPGECRNIPFPSVDPENQSFAILETILPLPTLLIAGAGHIGKALAQLGKRLGFEVVVWDDREEYANKINIPEADIIITGSMDNIPGNLVSGRDTYIVIVTRGHKNDADVLRKFIKTEAAYIGMIGSRAKVKQMRAGFIEEGWATTKEWNRIHSPVGLDIGAKTVEEIAVSIAAQLILVRNVNSGSNG